MGIHSEQTEQPMTNGEELRDALIALYGEPKADRIISGLGWFAEALHNDSDPVLLEFLTAIDALVNEKESCNQHSADWLYFNHISDKWYPKSDDQGRADCLLVNWMPF